MAGGNDQEKTEQPTGKRLNEAHGRGQFPKSQELPTAMIVAAAFSVVALAGRDKATEIAVFASTLFDHLHEFQVTEESISKSFREALTMTLVTLMPLLIAVTVAAILAGGLQSGFRLTPKAMEAKLSKLSPIKGFGKIFNKRNLIQLLVDLLKFSALLGILYGLVKSVMNDPIFSAPVPIVYVGEFLYRLFMQMMARLLVAMVVIAAIDYLWQRFKTLEELKMTKQEVKDEMKSAEGDPLIKGQRRRLAVKILQQQMTKAIPTADVVVTNPTHFAVALKYEQGIDRAPVVVAKGEGRFARRIKEIAREHGVPMVENKPVARLLFKAGRVNQTIPLELYQVVAGILAHVYRNHRYYFHRLKVRRQAEAALRHKLVEA